MVDRGGNSMKHHDMPKKQKIRAVEILKNPSDETTPYSLGQSHLVIGKIATRVQLCAFMHRAASSCKKTAWWSPCDKPFWMEPTGEDPSAQLIPTVF